MSMSTYYHYTDKEGLIGILKSRKIRKSIEGRFGSEMAGKVNYTVSVSLPDHRMKRFTQKDRKGRVAEIFLFKEDVYLDKTTYKLYSKHGDHRKLQKKYDHESDSSEDEEDEDTTSSEDKEDSSSSDE